MIQSELAHYEVDLSKKPQLVVITKLETVDAKALAATTKAIKKVAGDTPIFAISAQAHQGLMEVLRAASLLVKDARAAREQQIAETAIPVIELVDLPDFWRVTSEEDGVFRVTGERIEGFARRTNFEEDDGVRRLRDILAKTGVARELRRQGAEDGDIIHIGDTQLAWLS